jgi:hypothetical protein
MTEEAKGMPQFGVGKYVLLAVVGIFLIASGTIISAARTYVSAYEGTYEHLTFASSVVRSLGIAFLCIPLFAGGMLRDDFNPYVRLGMLVAGGILLGWLF